MDDNRKRITMKLKTPNPLFIKWVTEWRDKAIEKDSRMQYCFHKALESLKKYPLPLESGRDCKILSGFGNKLCHMLDNKLMEYKKSNGEQFNIETTVKTTNKRLSLEKNVDKNYVPSHRSGAYAILLALYTQNLESSYQGCLSKADIIKHGQKFCDKSFTKPDPGSYYTAWSAMKILLNKRLLIKQGSPPKFSLTEQGRDIASNLYVNSFDDKVQTDTLNEHRHSNVKNNNIIRNINVNNTNTECHNPETMSNKSVNSKNTHSLKDLCFAPSAQESTSAQCETLIFAPYTFRILLLVDTKETVGKNSNPLDDPLIAGLDNLHVEYEVRHLKVGDFTWICRHNETKKELVLPYIIERKRMDDFGSSIKDGRFHEQKFRLKQSGIQNLIYLVESHGDNTHSGLPLNTLYQAATNTLVQDGFCVKFTENLRGTVEYLSCLSAILTKMFKGKTMMSCSKKDINKISIEDDLIPLLVFEEFNKSASKNKDLTVRDMFIRNLLQLKGISLDKAIAIVEKYPTPRHLRRAYQESSVKDGERLLSLMKFGKLKKNLGPVISKTVHQFYTMKQYPC